MKNFLTIKNLSKTYIGGYNAINDISFELSKGGKFAILGGYVSGKTTLLSIIAGLESATSGEIILNGKCINNFKIKDRNIGFLDKSLQLAKFKKVKDIIVYPLKLRKVDNNDIADKLIAICNLLGISDLLSKKVKSLSQYQKTLVAVARLFICDRDLYLIDDIFDNLSLPEQQTLIDKIKKLIVDKTVVFAFSSYDIALNFTFENVLLLAYSTIVMMGNIHNKENFANTLAGYKFVNNKKICSIPISLDNKKIYVEENEFANNLKLKSEIFDKGLLALTTDKISFNNSKQVVISAEIYYINKFNIAYLDINSDIATIYLDHPYKEGDKLTLSFDISDGILYDFESERRIST